MNNIDILEEKIEKDYRDMMKVINSTSLPLFVEDTIEDMHILIETLIAENKELKEKNKTMLSDEEKKAIEEQYKEGLVNLSNVIEPLINQFKTDYSLDIQQCRLIINYLLMERDFNEDYYDELDKEIEELKEKNRQAKMRIVQLENEISARIEDVNTYYIPKSKIKTKIEEVKDGTYDAKIVLQSLLGKE